MALWWDLTPFEQDCGCGVWPVAEVKIQSDNNILPRDGIVSRTFFFYSKGQNTPESAKSSPSDPQERIRAVLTF